MPRTRDDLSAVGREQYDEMIQRIRILKEVASYYFLKGNKQERTKTADAIYESVKKFYGTVVKANSCGSRCWDAKQGECVTCPPKGQMMKS